MSCTHVTCSMYTIRKTEFHRTMERRVQSRRSEKNLDKQPKKCNVTRKNYELEATNRAIFRNKRGIRRRTVSTPFIVCSDDYLWEYTCVLERKWWNKNIALHWIVWHLICLYITRKCHILNLLVCKTCLALNCLVFDCLCITSRCLARNQRIVAFEDDDCVWWW